MADESSRVAKPQREWLTGLMLVVLVGLMAGFGWWLSPVSRPTNALPEFRPPSPVEPVRAERYVGNRACAECHPGETAHHAQSAHARTLRPAVRSRIAHGLEGRSVVDPEEPEVQWQFHFGDERAEIERREKNEDTRLPVDYVFGSGIHGVTFLSLKSAFADPPPYGAALEHRISYYTKRHALDITVGQEASAPPSQGARIAPEGRWLDEERTLGCFVCHTTLTSASGNTHLETSTMILNIGCERCHGPGREHIAAARRGESELWMPNGPDARTPNDQLRSCGECHRHALDTVGKPFDPDDGSLLRFPPIGLMRARCYQAGLSGLRCTTCHDPHTKTSTDQASYEHQCVGCHEAAPARVCRIAPAPADGCLGCHMPKRKSPEGFVFTDHWIRTPRRGEK
jgi:hypothetical protein